MERCTVLVYLVKLQFGKHMHYFLSVFAYMLINMKYVDKKINNTSHILLFLFF